MTAKKKATAGKTETKKLRLKKETIRDLDVQKKGSGVKGGSGEVCTRTFTVACPVQK